MRRNTRRWPTTLVFVVLVALAYADGKLPAYRPTAEELKEAYRRADSVGREYSSKAFMLRLEPHWYNDGKTLWYRKDSKGGKREFISVEVASGEKHPAFDHVRLAKALSEATSKTVPADDLPFREIGFLDDATVLGFQVEGQHWRCDLATYELKKADAPPRRQEPPRRPWRQDLWPADLSLKQSPDRTWSARIRDDFNVYLRRGDGEERKVTDSGSEGSYFARLQWAPDGKNLIATRVNKGDRKEVYLVDSSPRAWGPAILSQRVYDRPGDKVDTFDIWIIDPEAGTAKQITENVDYGGLPGLRWRKDNRHLTFEKMDRGYGRWRIFEVDSHTGECRTLVDDDPATFVDSTAHYRYYCRESEDIIWRSERDGWGHLYYTTADGRLRNQITKGPWVVRSVVRVDEAAKEITFTASGMNPKEDPYFVHYYRINLDGTGLAALTPEPGNHSVAFSPDRETYVDTYSQPDVPPVHELRRSSDGKLIALLERADVSDLNASGWRAPEVFVAKGRDGKTDTGGSYSSRRTSIPRRATRSSKTSTLDHRTPSFPRRLR